MSTARGGIMKRSAGNLRKSALCAAMDPSLASRRARFVETFNF